MQISTKALERLLPFVAFLQRHIHTISHDNLFLVYDYDTTLEANFIAEALYRIPIATFLIDCSNAKKNGAASKQRTLRPLYVSLVGEAELFAHVLDRSGPTRMDRHYKYIFVLKARRTLDRKSLEFRNAIYCSLANTNLEFAVWNFSDSSTTRFIRFRSETSFIESVHWLIFLAQLKRIPPDVDLVQWCPISCPFFRCLIRYKNRRQIAGLLVGLDNLIAAQVGARSHTYRLLDEGNQNFQPVLSVDVRQSVDFVEADDSFKHVWSFGMFGTGDWINTLRSEYVVLAPRRRTGTRGNGLQVSVFAHKVQLVAGLAAFVFVLAALRWTNRFLVQSAVTDLEAIFFDTFARVLSIAPGPFQGSTLERCLLAFTAAISIVLSGILSSALLEEILRPPQTEYYNSWQELKDGNMEIVLPPSMLNTSTQEVLKSNTVIKLSNPQITPDKAFVVTRNFAIWHLLNDRRGDHRLLEQPYSVAPLALYTSHWYLEHPILASISRNFENGILYSLAEACNHLVILQLQLLPEDESVVDESSGEGSLMDNWLIGMGLISASIVFAGELMAQRVQALLNPRNG